MTTVNLEGITANLLVVAKRMNDRAGQATGHDSGMFAMAGDILAIAWASAEALLSIALDVRRIADKAKQLCPSVSAILSEGGET